MALRSELIAKSMEVEDLTAVFYERLKAKLPRHAALCDELIEGERKHKRIIEEGARLIFERSAPDEIILPSIVLLRDTCVTIQALTAEMESPASDERRAWELALKVEQSTGEGYLQAAIKFAKSEALHALFKSIGVGERSHQQIIMDYMNSRGIQA